MNFDILLPIKPYYAYLIMKGEKTIEVRKFNIKNPNWSGKFKCYVSKDKTSLKRIHEADRAEFEKYLGKVAFEFARDKVYQYSTLISVKNECDISDEDIERLSCLSHKELSHYEHFSSSHTYGVFGITITALKIYDKPKELWEFRKVYKKDCEGFIKCDRNPCNYVDKETGKYIYHDCVKECPHLAEKYKVTHAPQSYMRIEEDTI